MFVTAPFKVLHLFVLTKQSGLGSGGFHSSYRLVGDNMELLHRRHWKTCWPIYWDEHRQVNSAIEKPLLVSSIITKNYKDLLQPLHEEPFIFSGKLYVFCRSNLEVNYHVSGHINVKRHVICWNNIIIWTKRTASIGQFERSRLKCWWKAKFESNKD